MLSLFSFLLFVQESGSSIHVSMAETDRQRQRVRETETDRHRLRETEGQTGTDRQREYGRFIYLGYCPS